jgi:hypothetical protein
MILCINPSFLQISFNPVANLKGRANANSAFAALKAFFVSKHYMKN